MRADPEPLGDSLGVEEVRERAIGGAAVLGARGALVFAFGLGANIALARMLSPRDFGIVALGSVLLVVGTYMTDGGLGAALIRRAKPPERIELQAVAGLQIAVSAALAALGSAAALAVGDDGLVIAAMLASLPITSAKLPAAIVLERSVQYRAIAFVDVVEAVVYYAWALAAVGLGAGVWGLATAVVARALVGVVAMARVGPTGLVRPRWSWWRVRPLIAFGAKLQATALVAVGRDQGMNVGVGAIAGIATLGVWSLAYRILQIPTLVITTAVRVSFPAMSRLLAAGQDPRPVIERGIATVAVGMGAVIVALAGCAPAALPALLGDGWEDVPATLLWAGVGLLLSAPVVVATIGYLYATDNAGTVVRATAAHAAVWFAVAFPLLPALGSPAVGVAWVPAGLVMAAVCGRRAAQLTGAAVLRSLAAPTAVALAACAAGWWVALSTPETLLGGAAGLLAGELVLVAGIGLAKRSLLTDTGDLVARAVRGSLVRGSRVRESPTS